MSVNSREQQIFIALQKKYGQADAQVISQLVVIKLLLMDQAYGNQVLSKLQQTLAQNVASIDNYLKVQEQEQGFEERELVDYVLDRDTFLEKLRQKKHLFDLGTPPDHGIHTHRLQWYIICQAVQESHIVLDRKPVEIYAAIGDPTFHDPSMQNRSIWDEIFDFDGDSYAIIGLPSGTAEVTALQMAGYSSPEYMQGCLTMREVLAPGVLVRELRLLRLRQATFRDGGILNLADALRNGIQMKAYMRDSKVNLDQLAIDLAPLSVEELEARYGALDPSYQENLAKIKADKY